MNLASNTKLILKSDQEPAIQDFVREIARMRSPAEMLKEESPVGSSASNGVVERGVQTVQGQVRVLKDAFETRISTKVDGSHNIISWMIEFASVLVNRYEVGHDGKTPHERSRGKKSRLLGLEFGEILNFKRAKPARKLAKLDIRWSDGVFLVYRSNSGEMIIGTAEGVFRTRSVQRKPEESRWDKASLGMVGGVPWQTSPDQDSAEVLMPTIDIPMEIRDPRQVPAPPMVDFQPRRVYLRSKDVEKFGATPGCRGCRAVMSGTTAAGHSEACRARITSEMMNDDCDRERVETAEKRRRVLKDEPAGRTGQKRLREPETEGVEDAESSSSSGSSSSGSSSDDMEDQTDETGKEKRKRQMVDDEGEEQTKRLKEVSRTGHGDMNIETVVFDDGYLQTACQEAEEIIHELRCVGNSDLNFFDSKTGAPLERERVVLAREDEIRELERRVYVEVDVNECLEENGKGSH